MARLEEQLKCQARALGFELVGIASAGPADGFDHLLRWLDAGHAGHMGYMYRHAQARRHPESILASVRSVIMVGMNYRPAPAPTDTRRGRISCYAQGNDYHDVLRARLQQLLDWLGGELPGCRGRIFVDTAPLLERDFARRAGLGWFGKNTMLLNKRLGSLFFLGGLLVDIPLEPDAPHETSHCGSCRRCLDACPTNAFVGPYELDARRCISYLTIELRGPIAPELRPAMGDWLFGCDVCQDVCPWNHKAPPGSAPELQPRPDIVALDPEALLRLGPEQFRERFRGTALVRPGRAGLLRNAAIVLGNRGDRSALPALRQALDDPEPLVREAARWAVERIGQRRPDTTGGEPSPE